MKASFEIRTPPPLGVMLGSKDKPRAQAPTEYVRIEFPNGDIVNRQATDQDRLRFKAEYAAFLATK